LPNTAATANRSATAALHSSGRGYTRNQRRRSIQLATRFRMQRAAANGPASADAIVSGGADAPPARYIMLGNATHSDSFVRAGVEEAVGAQTPADALAIAAAEAQACRRCETMLPLGPRPTFRVSNTARVLIIGQAPGTRVHATGIPWNDASGDRLRLWLALDRDAFYDQGRIAIVPMGLCYPGRLPNGGDAPPRPECAPLWLDRFVRLMPQIRLTLLVGSYAQRHRLGPGAMTDRVRRFADLGPAVIPLPHPSWRTTAWERRNPWFGAALLPVLRDAVCQALVDRI
jgi:uracil-DNA glycosylase